MDVKWLFQMWAQRNKNLEFFGKFLKERYHYKEAFIKEVTIKNSMDIKQRLSSSISISLKKVTLSSSHQTSLSEIKLSLFQTKLNWK